MTKVPFLCAPPGELADAGGLRGNYTLSNYSKTFHTHFLEHYLDFWNYGAHWLWGKPDYRRALKHYALVRDGDSTLHSLNFVQSTNQGLVYQYWFLNHLKLPEGHAPSPSRGSSSGVATSPTSNPSASIWDLSIFIKKHSGPSVLRSTPTPCLSPCAGRPSCR